MDIDLLRRDECPQQFTSEQVTTIKNAVKGRRGNVNITPYHIYDYDEHQVGEWRETIDGVKKCKPVYEKNVATTSPSGSSWQTLYTETDTEIVKIENCFITISGKKHYIPYANSANLGIQGDSVYIYIADNEFKSKPAEFIVQYIKDSDEWEVVVE